MRIANRTKISSPLNSLTVKYTRIRWHISLQRGDCQWRKTFRVAKKLLNKELKTVTATKEGSIF